MILAKYSKKLRINHVRIKRARPVISKIIVSNKDEMILSGHFHT